MRNILLLILLILSLQAKEQKVVIGLGPYFQTQPYKDVDPIIIPSPVIFFDNGLLYMRWSRGGVYFLGEKGDKFSWGVSLTAQPRTFNYSPDDSIYLQGMEEKKSTIEGGFALSMLYEKRYLEIMLLTDILDRYESWILKAEFGDEFEFGDLTLYPSFIITYQSKDFINYYYGVSAEESARTPYEIYTPGDGISLGFQTYANYPLTENLSALFNARVDRIPTSAGDSPLIETSYVYSGLASLIYTFTY